MKILLLFLAILGTGFLPAMAECATIASNKDVTTELWEGRALTARFRVGMCYSPDGKARGVLFLRHASGQEDAYHLYGTLKNGHFELSHSSGHSFKGDLTGDDSMKGKARLKSGMSLTLSGKRHRNVPLASEDCAPLQ